MMIPINSDYVRVMGKPTLFGTQESVSKPIDVMTGDLSSDAFQLAEGEKADLQVAILGHNSKQLALSGGYKEFYLAVNKNPVDGFSLVAKFTSPDESAIQKAKDVANKNNLTISEATGKMEISGEIKSDNLGFVLVSLLKP
jgi:hypothetical protein